MDLDFQVPVGHNSIAEPSKILEKALIAIYCKFSVGWKEYFKLLTKLRPMCNTLAQVFAIWGIRLVSIHKKCCTPARDIIHILKG